jgi:5-methyltetrahydrofolate--homocysteine methyltransferase
LTSDRAVLADGAFGTELQRLGLGSSECADVWNLTHPDLVEAVARSYVIAGSEIILTNTFRANATALATYGLADSVEVINRAGVAIAMRAAQGTAKVFGCVGPCDDSQGFERQAHALARAGVDAIVVETITNIEEARTAAKAVKRTGLPVIVSFSFASTGARPEDAAKAMADCKVYAVGANCGTTVDAFADICARMCNACDLPVWIKPSAGLPRTEHGRPTYRISPRQFAAAMAVVIEAGASFVGGCCGTTPEFIRELKKEVQAWPQPD